MEQPKGNSKNWPQFSGFEQASKQVAPMMAEFIKQSSAKTIVEIGVAYSTTTLYLCKAALETGGHVFGFDVWEIHGNPPHRQQHCTKEDCEQYLKDNGISNYTLTKISSMENNFGEILKAKCPIIDFAFIDGLHSYDGIKADFLNVYPLLSKTGIICLDDTLRITGCREFIHDLRTKYNDGTFDIINLPWKKHGPVVFGQSFLVKRSFPYLDDKEKLLETEGSPSAASDILFKEKEWHEKQKTINFNV